MRALLIAILVVLSTISYTVAAERRPLAEVDADSFTDDTQITPANAGDDHIALTWWVPNEFWISLMAREETTSETDKQALLDLMAGTSLLAVVQADITPFGAFTFYSKEEIATKMTISFTNSDGKTRKLVPMTKINPDLDVVLGMFKPILSGAMGNLGTNMHFYVLNDKRRRRPGWWIRTCRG